MHLLFCLSAPSINLSIYKQVAVKVLRVLSQDESIKAKIDKVRKEVVSKKT